MTSLLNSIVSLPTRYTFTSSSEKTAERLQKFVWRLDEAIREGRISFPSVSDCRLCDSEHASTPDNRNGDSISPNHKPRDKSPPDECQDLEELQGIDDTDYVLAFTKSGRSTSRFDVCDEDFVVDNKEGDEDQADRGKDHAFTCDVCRASTADTTLSNTLTYLDVSTRLCRECTVSNSLWRVDHGVNTDKDVDIISADQARWGWRGLTSDMSRSAAPIAHAVIRGTTLAANVFAAQSSTAAYSRG